MGINSSWKMISNDGFVKLTKDNNNNKTNDKWNESIHTQIGSYDMMD